MLTKEEFTKAVQQFTKDMTGIDFPVAVFRSIYESYQSRSKIREALDQATKLVEPHGYTLISKKALSNLNQKHSFHLKEEEDNATFAEQLHKYEQEQKAKDDTWVNVWIEQSNLTVTQESPQEIVAFRACIEIRMSNMCEYVHKTMWVDNKLKAFTLAHAWLSKSQYINLPRKFPE